MLKAKKKKKELEVSSTAGTLRQTSLVINTSSHMLAFVFFCHPDFQYSIELELHTVQMKSIKLHIER